MDILNINWKWEDMCGPEGFHPWNDTSKDFGYCFQELCLQVPVFFITAIVSAYYLGYRNDWVIREKPQDRALVLRSFIVLALVFIPIIDLYVLITEPGYVLYPIVYFVAGASCLCWLVHFGYVLALRHRLGPSSRGPTSLLVCWGAAVVLNILSLRSNSMTGASIASDIATLCCHGLYLLTLVPHSQTRQTYYSPCLVGSRHNHNEYTPLLPHIDDGILGTAMQGAGLWSKLTFSWVEPLFLKAMGDRAPVISGAPPLVRPGDQLMLNCSSDYSLPPSNINWYIDGELQKPEPWEQAVISSPREGGLRASWRVLRVTAPARGSGALRVTCEAELPLEPPLLRDSTVLITVHSHTHPDKYVANRGQSSVLSLHLLKLSLIWTFMEIYRFMSL